MINKILQLISTINQDRLLGLIFIIFTLFILVFIAWLHENLKNN